MNVHYWVIELDKPTLKRIIEAHDENGVVTVHAVSASKSALRMLEKENRRRRQPVGYEKITGRIGPPGPVLNISEVRNEKREVIIMDIYHHVLSLRSRIIQRLLKQFGEAPLFKDRNPESMLVATMGVRIAEEITPAVFLADFIRWKDYYKPDTEKQTIKNILILPSSDWSKDLEEDFRALGLNVETGARKFWKFRRMAAVAKNILTALLKRGFSRIRRTDYSHRHTSGKIMVTYAMGLMADQRNDITFYFSSGMKPSRLLVFFKNHPSWLSQHELNWLQENEISHFAAPEIPDPIPDVPVWSPGVNLRVMEKQFCEIYLSTMMWCLGKRRAHSFWLLRWAWKTGMEIAWWKDFFLSNNVSMVVHSVPSEENFIPHTAIAEIGGLAVSIERSILFDYCTYIHNAPNHLHFITGAYSLKQIPEPTFSLYTVFSGGININGNGLQAAEVQSLRKQAKFVIAIFDEMPNDVFFGESVREMYVTLAGLALADPRFSLLIKSKKPQVLEKLPDVRAQLNELANMGRCYMSDWQVTAADAASHADIVTGVPSTAVFESVLTGVRTIVFNPMRSGSSIFYKNNGLNRRIFEDSHLMKSALTRFADGMDDSVGDCRDIANEIDPFNDNSGALRLGEYLNQCLDGFDKHMSWEEILNWVNKEYSERWGGNTIFTVGAYEWMNRAPLQ